MATNDCIVTYSFSAKVFCQGSLPFQGFSLCQRQVSVKSTCDCRKTASQTDMQFLRAYFVTEYEVPLLINFNLVDIHAHDFYCLALNSSSRLDS